MKTGFKYSYTLLIGLFLLFGCYEDEGCYDYRDINEVSIELPGLVSVRLSKTDSVPVNIQPELSQTLAENETYLSFKWERERRGTYYTEWEEISQSRELAFYLSPSDVETKKIRLTVTDSREDGSVWYKELTLKPIVPYSRCWFVLQNDGGKSIVGAVDGEGSNGVVIPDVYKTDMKQDLPISGTPKQLITYWEYGSSLGTFINPRQEPVIFVVTDQDVHQMNAVSFEQIYTYPEMLYIKTSRGESNFAPDWLYSYTRFGLGEILSNDGELYVANDDGYAVYKPLAWADEVQDDCKITKVAPMQGIGYILYDELKHRFLKCDKYSDMMEAYMSNTAFRRFGMTSYFQPSSKPHIRSIEDNPALDPAFDPNAIETDHVILSMNMIGSTVLATAFSTSDGKLHVYDLNGDGFYSDAETAVCVGKYTIDLPATINHQDICFATSYPYEKTLFMGAGNKIYKLDFNRSIARSTVIYEHTNANVKITGLKFKNEFTDWGGNVDPNDWESEWIWYGFPYGLGASLDYGGNDGGILELKLTTAGEIESGSEILEHKGFGKIVDFGYSVKE